MTRLSKRAKRASKARKTHAISIYLGRGELGEQRRDALYQICTYLGVTGKDGEPSPSVLMQLLADGDASVAMHVGTEK